MLIDFTIIGSNQIHPDFKDDQPHPVRPVEASLIHVSTVWLCFAADLKGLILDRRELNKQWTNIALKDH